MGTCCSLASALERSSWIERIRSEIERRRGTESEEIRRTDQKKAVNMIIILPFHSSGKFAGGKRDPRQTPWQFRALALFVLVALFGLAVYTDISLS